MQRVRIHTPNGEKLTHSIILNFHIPTELHCCIWYRLIVYFHTSMSVTLAVNFKTSVATHQSEIAKE